MNSRYWRMAIGTAALAVSALAQAEDGDDLTDLSLEALLDVEVYSASLFTQRASDAPAVISVITAEDIRTHGYRTLLDALRSLPGLYTNDDRAYASLGVSGILRTGDYASRVLQLVDGQRLNDPLYDAAVFGTEFPIDIERVERIEFLRGPASAVYGSNAVLGVVNIVTRHAAPGFSGNAGVGGFGEKRARGQWDGLAGDDLGLSFSVSHIKTDGDDVDVPELGGRLTAPDGFTRTNLFAQATGHGWRVQAAHGVRDKNIALPYAFTILNDPRNRYQDGQGYVNLLLEQPGETWTFSERLYHGHYDYEADLPYDDGNGGSVLNRDGASARWWGLRAQALYRGFDAHQLVFGAMHQNDYRLDQFDYDIEPYLSFLDSRETNRRYGAFVADEWQLDPALALTLGARYDHYRDFDGNLSPRLALVWKPLERHVLKLQYGEAFRVANAFSRYYDIDGEFAAHPDLKPETVRTVETSWQFFPDDSLRLHALAQWARLGDQIEQGVNADNETQFLNSGAAAYKGLDLEAEKLWDDGLRLRGSVTFQDLHDATPVGVMDSPRRLAKLHASAPVATARLGLEAVHVGARPAMLGAVSGYVLINATISEIRLADTWAVDASIYNLLDEDYGDPAAGDLAAQGVNAVPQEGRNFRLTLEGRF